MNPPQLPVFSVAQFIEHLNTAFAGVIFPFGAAIEGEVAEYRVSQDKWVWFLLKDKDAVISCFSTVWQLRQPLEDGMKVRIFGTPKIHGKSGKFSFVVDRAEPLGEGSLKRAFELLKKALASQGVFAQERKRPLPKYPESIVLIASRESAAYTDFLRIFKERWGGITIHTLHVQVQGQGAIPDIVGAFRYVNAHPELGELIVLTRGGGSLEDLQAFNSEDVVRAIFGSTLPVVVGVGHERDETLADYVADVRASTPTNAAELIVPDRNSESRHLEQLVTSAARTLINQVRNVPTLQDFRRTAVMFLRRIDAAQNTLEVFAERVHANISRKIDSAKAKIDASERLLGTLDPRAILRRGYAIVWRGGTVIKNAEQLDSGSRIQVQFAQGTVQAKVETIDDEQQGKLL